MRERSRLVGRFIQIASSELVFGVVADYLDREPLRQRSLTGEVRLARRRQQAHLRMAERGGKNQESCRGEEQTALQN
jgi:hypothetical protein